MLSFGGPAATAGSVPRRKRATNTVNLIRASSHAHPVPSSPPAIICRLWKNANGESQDARTPQSEPTFRGARTSDHILLQWWEAIEANRGIGRGVGPGSLD